MSKNQVPVSLEAIGQLDNGGGAVIARAALNQAVLDTIERGQDGKARKVTLAVTFKKTKAGNIEVQLEAGVSLPKFATGVVAGTEGRDPNTGRRTILVDTDEVVEETEAGA